MKEKVVVTNMKLQEFAKNVSFFVYVVRCRFIDDYELREAADDVNRSAVALANDLQQMLEDEEQ